MRTATLLLAAFALGGCATSIGGIQTIPSNCPDREPQLGESSGGAVPYYEDVPEMVAVSDLVVVGTVVEITCEPTNRGRTTIRHTRVVVEEVWHGRVEGDLELAFRGDEDGGTMSVEGVPSPALGEQAVWLLEKGPQRDRPDGLVPIGPQGRYTVGDDGALADTIEIDNVGDGAAARVAALGLDGLREEVQAASEAVGAGALSDTWTGEPGEWVVEVGERRGSGHCGWQDTRFLFVRPPGGVPGDDVVFLANPGASLDEHLLDDASYEPDAALPNNARDTGWRRGAIQLWLTGPVQNASHAHLVHPDRVERLPRAAELPGCE